MILFYLCDVLFFFLDRIRDHLFLGMRIFCVTFIYHYYYYRFIYIKILNSSFLIFFNILFCFSIFVLRLNLDFQFYIKKANFIIHMIARPNECIFTSSKYYRLAYSSAQSIAEPLGHKFLSKKRQTTTKSKQSGPRIRKILFDKPIIKNLSVKRTPVQKVSQYLMVSDSKRKNTYLSSTPLSIINKTDSQIIQQIQSKYCPNISLQSKQTINFINSFNTLSDDAKYSIGDYSLSSYFIYYDGRNVNNLKYVEKLFNKEFIEYDIKTVTTNKAFQDYESQPNSENVLIDFQASVDNITSIDKINGHIQNIKQTLGKKDMLYSGLHFFVGDCTAKTTTYDILKEEIQNLKYLQYYLYLITAKDVLGVNQNFILKIRGALRHKTLQYLFFFKLLFNKVTIVKPQYSNFISNQKYLICQGYVRQNGQIIHSYIKQNFNILNQYGQEKLIINPQLIFLESYLTDNIKNFNDTLIIKGIKEIIDVYLGNSNVEIYPPKSLLVEKIKSFGEEGLLESILKDVQEHVPTEEEIKEDIQQGDNGSNKNQKQHNPLFKTLQKTPIVQQKQAQIDIFAFLKAKQQNKKAQKPAPKPQKQKINQQEELQKQLEKRYKQQQRIKQEMKKKRKQKEKKQKQQRKYKDDRDDYRDEEYRGHFDYAEG